LILLSLGKVVKEMRVFRFKVSRRNRGEERDDVGIGLVVRAAAK